MKDEDVFIVEESITNKRKSAEMQEGLLSQRHKQILECMELEVLYKTEDIAAQCDRVIEMADGRIA